MPAINKFKQLHISQLLYQDLVLVVIYLFIPYFAGGPCLNGADLNRLLDSCRNKKTQRKALQLQLNYHWVVKKSNFNLLTFGQKTCDEVAKNLTSYLESLTGVQLRPEMLEEEQPPAKRARRELEF